MKMKRVCIVKLGYFPEIMLLRRDAEALMSNGYQVDIICFRRKGEKAREKIGKLSVYRIPGEHHRTGILRYLFEYSYFYTMVSLTLSWLSLSRRRYDVVEVCSMPDFLVFSTVVPRLLGAKVILYLWENMPMLFMSHFKTGRDHIGAKILRIIERTSAGYADHVIVTDGIPYKQVLESQGVPSDKITVVLNVPDESTFNIEAIPSAKDGEKFRLVVVSTLTKRYGIQIVIKAIPLLLRDIPELMVDVTGRGEYRPELENLARDLGVNAYLNFTGMIPYEDVLSCIGKAQVGIAPMIEDVGVSNKLFEYFALGTPAVASALPSLTATFDSNCVLYFRPGDEKDLAERILELHRSPEKRASLAYHGKAFYSKCQWQ